MELERYLRDAKAGWVMGPTNEVLRQFVGKAVLLGFDVARLLEPDATTAARSRTRSRSSTRARKRELAEQLLAEAAEAEAKEPAKA